MHPKLMRTPDGEVILGQELEMHPDMEWRPTVTQVRDAILDFRVTGLKMAGLNLLPESAIYASTQEEVERFSLLCREAVTAGRMIDFGHLPNQVIVECARRGERMWGAGAFGPPFRNPWICYHTWDHQIVWQGEGPQPVKLPETKAIAVYLVNTSGDDHFEVCELQPMKFGNEYLLVIGDTGLCMVPPAGSPEGCNHVSIIAPSMLRFLADDTFRSLQNNGMSPQQAADSNISEPIICCLLILATRGVERETIEAPPKLQRARAKNRKPPIPNYDRVNTEPYVTAILSRGHRERGESLGGHHASPQFHIRMGHPRNYVTGRSIWIADTLVNATEEQRASFKGKRSHYEVRK